MKHDISFREALWTWLHIGVNSFGGPAGQIAVMHRILVEEKRWISEERFLHALSYCMLLPGPEAQQLAVYAGWLLHGRRGGLAAGTLFVLPGAAAMLGLSLLYAASGHVPLVQGLFYGLKPAVLAVVVEAVLRIGRRALQNELLWGLAATAFAAIFLLGVPFPLIVLGTGLFGLLCARLWPEKLLPPTAEPGGKSSGATIDTLLGEGQLEHTRPSVARALRTLAAGLTLWLGPLVLLAGWLGARNVYVQEGTFFSKMAVVTFGGAYAALAYVAQAAVTDYGWVKPGEMLDGLGLAETTPGPLILVLQFVGFLGAYRTPGALPPLLAGTLGAIVTLWATFVPCFLWIFLGAPYIEALRGNRWLSAALSAITAAVVGVILNLAVWFALHTLFQPFDPAALVLALLAMLALFRLKLGMLPTLASSAVLGLAWKLL